MESTQLALVTVRRRQDLAQVVWALRSLQRRTISRNNVLAQLANIKRTAPASFQFIWIKLLEAECPETEQRFQFAINKAKLFAFESRDAAVVSATVKQTAA